MTDDGGLGFFEWAFKGLVTLLFTVGGWLWLMLVNKVKEQDDVIDSTKTDLSDHQLYSSQNYTTKNDSNRQYDELCRKIDRVLDMISNRQHPTP